MIMIIQSPQHLQGPEHAIHPVELAAAGLSVKVTASLNRRQVWIAPFFSGKNISHLIDFNTTSDFPTPGNKQITSLAVEIGQCQSLAASFFGRADFGHFHQAFPKAVSIDFHHAVFLIERF